VAIPVFKVMIERWHTSGKVSGKSPEYLYRLVPTAGYNLVKNSIRLQTMLSKNFCKHNYIKARPVHMMTNAFLFPC